MNIAWPLGNSCSPWRSLQERAKPETQAQQWASGQCQACAGKRGQQPHMMRHRRALWWPPSAQGDGAAARASEHAWWRGEGVVVHASACRCRTCAQQPAVRASSCDCRRPGGRARSGRGARAAGGERCERVHAAAGEHLSRAPPVEIGPNADSAVSSFIESRADVVSSTRNRFLCFFHFPH